ncbi:MAG: hypothetical protein Q8M76_03515, partial [Spirochaetaceae bacterium]|nr:hypothetical protein [Spirochaetaceae bacterium]
LPWRIAEGRLVIPFRSGIEEDVVRGSLIGIAAAASESAGRVLKVELRVESPAKAGSAASGSLASEADYGAADPVAIVEKVFRGTRLPPRDQGA